MNRPNRFCHMALCVALLAPITAFAEAPLPGYRDDAGFREQIKSLTKIPGVTAVSLAQTRSHRDVTLLTLAHGDPDKKPAILILGNTHAPHLLGSELAVRMAQRLAADHADLLDRFTFYIIPRPDPDASENNFKPPFREVATDDRPATDSEAALDDPGPQDVNHDGFVTMMRVEDPAGDRIAHPDDPRILITADPRKNEQGRYKLYVEGMLNDDGHVNKDPAGGVAFDRNFPFQYPFFERGAGPHQVSEPQTRAVADFALDHPNIAAVFCFSPEDNLENPWKPGDDQRIKVTIQRDDAGYFDYVADQYRQINTRKDGPPSAEGHGSFVDWCYYHYGRWVFSARGWWVPKMEEPKPEGDKKPSGEKRGADQLNALRWLAQQKIDGFVEWKPFDHPDFPGKKVEIGGFKPLVLLNPPAAELDGLADEHTKFIMKLAELMPRVAIENVKVEPLGGRVFRVTAIVTNSGYLATMPEMGKINRVPYPLELVIDLPKDAAMIQGPARAHLGPIPGHGTAEHTWLFSTSAAEATVRLSSPETNSDSKTVKLP